MFSLRRWTLVILGLTVGAVAVFAFDVSVPLGFVGAYLYVVLVLLAGFTRRPQVVSGITIAALALTAIAYVFKKPYADPLPLSAVAFNRVGAAVVIVLTAATVGAVLGRDRRIASLGAVLEAVEGDRALQRRLLDAARNLSIIGTWSYDTDRQALHWSDEVVSIHGHPPGYQPTVDQAMEHYSEESRARLTMAIERAQTTGEPFMEECRIIDATDAERWVQVMGEAVRGASGKVERVQGVIHDVTMWKHAESLAADQRRRFSQFARSLPFVIWTATANGSIDYFNEAMERFSGRPLDQLLTDQWQTLIHPDDAETVTARWVEAIAKGEPFHLDFRIKNSVDEYRWHQVTAEAEKDADGTLVRWWGSAVDVHYVHMLRDRAGELADEREMILESIGDGVYTLDREWCFRYLNSTAEQLVNRTAMELVGASVWEEFPEVVDTDLYEIYHRAMEQRTEERLTNFNPVLQKWFDISVTPTEVGLTVFFRDITPLRTLSEQLAQAQRLESVGRLTGGIAHDFNNLLTVVLGGSEAIGSDPQVSDESREMAALMLEAAQRGADLTNRLLAFARRQPLEPRPVDVKDRLSALAPLLRRTLGENVDVHVSTAEELPLVEIDPSQFESALLNLAINARDAMPDGGNLTIEAEKVHLDEAYATGHSEVEPGTYVVVSVTDSGTGIEAEHLPKLFDPFFTTKDVGKGSGLGLAMVWGFVKQTGGHVSVYSELGIGTTFRMYLPLSRAGAEAAPEEPGSTSAPLDGTGHILLAEDDELVQRFASEQLRSHGYTVTVASSGPEALAALDSIDRSGGMPVDVLFTDVIMPGGMTGRMLADKVLERLPGLPVLYTSGYTENVIVHNGRLDAGVALLAKPYSARELLQRVHEVLAASREEVR